MIGMAGQNPLEADLSDSPRVLILSGRRARPPVLLCSGCEYEDVVSEIDSTHIVAPLEQPVS